MRSIDLTDVSRAFGREYALHRVSMTLLPGTLTVLLGANGAGKSTLMNILATLDRPTSGTIYYDDWDWQTFARRGRRNIGWVAHQSLVYDELTGRENLEFYAQMYGFEDSAALAGRWLGRVGLTQDADRKVVEYSRGMRQRLSIARALLHAPALLLLDEPLTGLDQQGRVDILRVLGTLRDQGRIVVMITHDLDLPVTLVDQVAVLRSGALAFLGPGGDLAQMMREHG